MSFFFAYTDPLFGRTENDSTASPKVTSIVSTMQTERVTQFSSNQGCRFYQRALLIQWISSVSPLINDLRVYHLPTAGNVLRRLLKFSPNPGFSK